MGNERGKKIITFSNSQTLWETLSQVRVLNDMPVKSEIVALTLITSKVRFFLSPKAWKVN